MYVRNSMIDRLAPTQPDTNGVGLVAGDRYGGSLVPSGSKSGNTTWRGGHEGVERCGIVTTATERVGAGELQTLLVEHRIDTSWTPPGSSRWDVERRHLPPLLRLSVHYTTTEDEIAAAVEVLASAT